MKRIALISDTHGYFGDDLSKHLTSVDEIWHAGDIGNISTAKKFESLSPQFRAVYGNIDDHLIRRDFQEYMELEIEGVKVLMIHIGGYPGRYSIRARELLSQNRFDLFISGHSHITKIMRDKKKNLIHMNPGSCGHHGFHTERTLIRFSVDKGQIFDVEVIELGRRGKIQI